MKIRIAVATTADGKWCAGSWHEDGEEEWRNFALDGVDDPDGPMPLLQWVVADVSLPTEPEVVGEVEAAT